MHVPLMRHLPAAQSRVFSAGLISPWNATVLSNTRYRCPRPKAKNGMPDSSQLVHGLDPRVTPTSFAGRSEGSRCGWNVGGLHTADVLHRMGREAPRIDSRAYTPPSPCPLWPICGPPGSMATFRDYLRPIIRHVEPSLRPASAKPEITFCRSCPKHAHH